MKKPALVSCVVLAAALAACKKDKERAAVEELPATEPNAEKPVEPATTPQRPASVTDVHVALADQFIAGMEAAAGAAVASKGDCKAMGKALTVESARLAATFDKMEAMKHEVLNDPAAKDWVQATYQDKSEAAFGKLMVAVEPCKHDEVVGAALSAIGPRKKPAEEMPSK